MTGVDPALALLLAQLPQARPPLLWAVDENTSCDGLPAYCGGTDCWFVCDRLDQHHLLESQGLQASVGDFSELANEQTPNTIILRLSKQKALVHYLVNRAVNLLPMGGELWLAGCKNEGIKTYAKKAAVLFGGPAQNLRGKNTSQLTRIVKQNPSGDYLPDDDFLTVRWLDQLEPGFFSKPGIYGWNKIDRGSRLLMDIIGDRLADYCGSISEPRLLDAGCGYGYLSVRAHQLCAGRLHITATDNHLPAARACRQNFDHYGINGEVIASDIADIPRNSVTAVLCNPPFHQGFKTSSDLTDHFLAHTRKALQPGGKAWFVTNQFIPIQRKAAGLFANATELHAADGFKVFELTA